MSKSLTHLFLAAVVPAVLPAQGVASAAKAPIADNSFFLEEAYNQEAGVVQHISSFSRTSGPNGWAYTFTQEWPFRSQRHQVGYTVAVLHAGSPSSIGLGDVVLNYRLQAAYDEARGVAISPRLSVSLPTGDEERSFGLGGTGVQINLPLSKTLGSAVVSHTNAGSTWFARAPGAGDASASLRAANLGQSVIWLVAPRFNVMLESAWTRTTVRSDRGQSTSETAFVIPGIRWAYDFTSGLQVVPGIAFPIGVGASRGTKQLFLYLSLEHPFRARR
jgi:hypothetical protein